MNEAPPPKHVLIIDDDKLVRDFATDTIEYGTNRQVTTFDNGIMAWQYIQNHFQSVTAIIADANIPEMDGFELLEKIKFHYPQIFFVMTTSNPNNEKIASRLGADVFLLKPFEVHTLFKVMELFMGTPAKPATEKVTIFPNKAFKDNL